MGVYKNKTTGKWEWVEIINNEQIRRRSKKWVTKKQAQEALDKFKEDMFNKNNTFDMTFNEVAEDYLEYEKIRNKLSTWKKSHSTYNFHLKDTFGKMKANEITSKDILNWQKTLLNKKFYTKSTDTYSFYSNRTLEIMQQLLAAIFKYAYENSYIKDNPIKQAVIVQRKQFEQKKSMTIITNDQFNDFMSVIDNQTDRALYSILYWCGLRFGEALALNIQDYSSVTKELDIHKNYDPKNKVITTTKTNEVRIVSVPDKCAIEIETLLDLYKDYHIKNIQSFPLIGLTVRPNPSQARREKNKYIELANKRILEHNVRNEIQKEIIPEFTFHELRHTHVSTLIELGMTSKDISDRLGHSVEMVNNTYGHLFPKRKDEILDKLNNL